jgi:hypothetical protein
MPRTRSLAEICSLAEWGQIWEAFEGEMAQEFLRAAGTLEVEQVHRRLDAGRDLRQFMERRARDGK